MIKILELESSKGWGGQEKRTVRLVNNLDKKEFIVFWGVQPDSKLYKNKDSINATFIPLTINKSYDFFAIKRVVDIVKKYNIDIISTHSGKDGWVGAIAGLFTGVKVVRTRHLQTPISSNISYNLSDKVVAVSNKVYNYLLKEKIKKDKLELIYTGIDTNKFNPEIKKDLRKELNLSKNTILIGIVAVLRAAKRHIDLIKAFSEIETNKKTALIIIGQGPQEKNIKLFIKEGKFKNIFLLGHREDIHLILPSLDIFVLPSKMEALGTAILEASSCGVACIGSKTGGIPEIIMDNKTGLLFEPGNIQELKSKLETLINNDSFRIDIGKNARNFIVSNFSVEKMVKNTEKLYKGLL